jgi:hypothetical protein
VANWAAQLEFQKERFRLLEMPQFQQGLQLEVDKFAWQKAMDTWDKAYQEASLTGTYNGQPTIQWLTEQARLTGTYNGQRTLEGLLTDAQIKDMEGKLKLANDQFLAETTGYINGQKTFDREKFETATAQDAWKFLAGLTGASNAFKQARAIASMPGGIQQMMEGFAGKYFMPGSTAVGSSGGHFNLDDMMQGFGGNYAPGAAPPPGSGQQPPSPAPLPVGTNPIPEPGYGPQPPRQSPEQGAYIPGSDGPIPGRGFTPAQWNDATRAAVAQWEAAHPGYKLDGSQRGWTLATPGAGAPSPAPGAGTDVTTMTAQGMLYSPPGVQAPPNAYNYTPTGDGGAQIYPPGVVSPYTTPDISTTAPINPALAAQQADLQNQQAAYNLQFGGPYQYQPGIGADPSGGASSSRLTGPLQADNGYQVGGVVGGGYLPNQINARNYDNAYDYQRELMWAAYEDQGWDKGLAQEAFMKSLPKYGGPSKGAFAF